MPGPVPPSPHDRFAAVIGDQRGAGAITIDVRSYVRGGEGQDLRADLSPTGIEFRGLDGQTVAHMTWEAFAEQLSMTMLGGFVISPELMVDIDSLHRLWGHLETYRAA